MVKKLSKRLDRYYRRGETSKLPRKIKKLRLGRKMNASELKKRIASVEIETASLENGYSWPIPSDEFCPDCGCEASRSGPSMASYPEVYYYDYCLRCGAEVGCADNSQFIHVLVHIKENEYLEGVHF